MGFVPLVLLDGLDDLVHVLVRSFWDGSLPSVVTGHGVLVFLEWFTIWHLDPRSLVNHVKSSVNLFRLAETAISLSRLVS